MHADTSGPVRPSTASGFRRVLVVVDDASRWIYVALLRTADMLSISRALRLILRDAANGESVLRTKILRTDNGGEFKNALVDKLLAEGDIVRGYTCVGTSHQNPVAERAIGILFATARTMLVDSSLPPQFWGEALMTAVHIRNRMSCSSNPGNASPYEVRFGRRPDLSHLRPFGVSAFVRIQRHTTKVSPRAQQGVFVGYGHSISRQKGWRIFLPASNKVVTTTDVHFESSISASVASRDASFVSTDPFTVEDTATDAPEQSPVSSLPASLQLQPHTRGAAPARRLTGTPPASNLNAHNSGNFPLPPTSVDLIPTTLSPNVNGAQNAASNGSNSLQNSQVTKSVARPRGGPPNNSTWDPVRGKYVRNAVPATPQPATASSTPTITAPSNLHELSESSPRNMADIPRPRGRPPANSRWDPREGKYVPVITGTTQTTPNQL